MKPNLIFSGRIGSGKTQLSKAVASALGFRWNSFGSTLRTIAVERSLPTTREHLQALGEVMVANESENLCRRVIVEAKPFGSQPIVIDGLRHCHIRDMLQRLMAPQQLLVIYVDVPDAIRLERLRVRDGLTDFEVRKFEEHSTEIQVAAEIRVIADYSADNSGELEVTVAAITSRV
jgi:dephospho-CoA kinase